MMDATSLRSTQRLARRVHAAAVLVAMLAMLAGGGCAGRRCAASAPVERFGHVTKSENATLLERRGDEVRLESWSYRVDVESVVHSTPRIGRMPGTRGSARLACPGAPWTATTFDYEFSDTGVVLWRREPDASPFTLTRVGPSVDVSETLQPIPQDDAPPRVPQRRRICWVPPTRGR